MLYERTERPVKVVGLEQIKAVLDEDAALAAVERAFRRFAAGEAQVTSVGHLHFTSPPGDCHVKSGAFNGDPVFVIKIATSFYLNPQAGLPVGNGLMAVMSARTGEVLALLHDEGYLTDQRTAMAGAIAARAIARSGSKTLGIVGAGVQAHLQGKMLSRLLGIGNVLVWARNAERAAALARKLGGEATGLEDLCARSDVIVTTTPSTEPLLRPEMIRAGTRIVAVGADAPGKRELDARILAGARVVVDSKAQCVDHGEAGWAVRAGLIDEASLIELGALLAAPVAFRDTEVVIADLTGVAIQDVAIAESVWTRLQEVV
jgi:ornithine cyclodeaminase